MSASVPTGAGGASLSAFLVGSPLSDLSPAAQQLVRRAKEAFQANFGGQADNLSIGLAPGRVNLIGEHTDYNGGFVMPLAIDRHTVVCGRPNGLQKYRVVSANANQGKAAAAAAAGDDAMMTDAAAATSASSASAGASAPSVVELTLAELTTKYQTSVWHNYFRGVVSQFIAAGHTVPCFDVAIVGDVPLGGGLSSSASLEVATAAFLQSLLQLPLDPIQRALLCQKAEHEFANVPCGCMDQFISSLAEKDHVMLLDCRSLVPQMVSFNDPNVALLITNSNVQHGLGDGQYEIRVRQCASAVKTLQLKYPEMKSLRDATLAQLQQVESAMDEVAFFRARHVVMENDRVQQSAVCLSRGEYARLGQLMTHSHVSMKNDYEISCDEIDCLVDIALELPGVFGSRMTGGGFGGCTITLVKATHVEKVQEAIVAEYKERTGRDATCIITRPAQGVRIVRA